MLDPAIGAKLIETFVGGFMGIRDQLAPRSTIRREVFDGAMSVAVIDSGAAILMKSMNLHPTQIGAARLWASNLLKFLYDIESRRFEQGGQHGAQDVSEAALNRAYSFYASEAMKGMAQHHQVFRGWDHAAAREASRRFATYIYTHHGDPRSNDHTVRW